MKKYLALILGLCLTVGLGGCANTPAEKTPETQPESGNEQFDIVIVGAGGAGLAAAVEAHEQGADNILVLEKMSFAGGSTTMAFGGFNCTNSRFMDEQGKEETPVM